MTCQCPKLPGEFCVASRGRSRRDACSIAEESEIRKEETAEGEKAGRPGLTRASPGRRRTLSQALQPDVVDRFSGAVRPDNCSLLTELVAVLVDSLFQLVLRADGLQAGYACGLQFVRLG